MLSVPLTEGDRMVVVASFGGDDRDPAWLWNVRANPRVRVTVDGHTRDMTAHEADEAERAELWPKVVAAAQVYAKYQQKTSRQIPLVVLEPAPA